MATTGTYTFNPAAPDVVMNAFAAIQVKRVDITDEHLENAAYWANMVGVDFTNRNPNRWKMAEVPFTLIAGTQTYVFSRQVVAVSAVWLDLTVAPGQIVTRPLGPMSAVDYALMAAKLQPGTPTSYFFDLRSPLPQITLWPVPTASPVYTLRCQTFQQLQDTNITNAFNADVPYRFLEAFTLGLAARLARIYAPAMKADLDNDYKAAFGLAASQEQESVPLRFTPQLSGYFPR